jgi:hypothetical protein
MAGALTEEALRAVQDAFPIHEALCLEYAATIAVSHLHTASGYTHCEASRDMAASTGGHICLGGCSAMVYEEYMGHALLVCGWGLDISGQAEWHTDRGTTTA